MLIKKIVQFPAKSCHNLTLFSNFLKIDLQTFWIENMFFIQYSLIILFNLPVPLRSSPSFLPPKSFSHLKTSSHININNKIIKTNYNRTKQTDRRKGARQKAHIDTETHKWVYVLDAEWYFRRGYVVIQGQFKNKLPTVP